MAMPSNEKIKHDPKVGDIMICAYCGNINKLDEQYALVALDENDLLEIYMEDEDTYYELLTVSHFLANTNLNEIT